MELTALALFAADGNTAAHRVYDAFRDCHAQPRAFRFLHAGVILPAEGIKNNLLIFL